MTCDRGNEICTCFAVINLSSFLLVLEYAICSGRSITLYDSDWKLLNNSQHSIEHKDFTYIKSITYDAANDVFYFANMLKNSGIYKLKVWNETSYEISPVLLVHDDDNIRDLVHDFKDNALYWSDAYHEKIFKLKLSPQGSVETFVNTNTVIQGLEIDSCKRNLFFAEADEGKIKVVSLDDRKVTEVSFGQHIRPVALAIDHQSRRLYVADNHGTSAHYSIDSILTDGSDFRREIDSAQKTPRSIAVDSEYVYYVEGDDHELRRYKKKFDPKVGQTSEEFKKFGRNFDPQDIIVRSNFIADLDSKLCQVPAKEEVTTKVEKIEEISTSPAPESSTESCSCKQNSCPAINRCDNFCLNNGKCSIVNDEPKCLCEFKFAGDRCETDACTNFCFNGECSVDLGTKQPRCKCDGDFTGERCEKSKTLSVPQAMEVSTTKTDCSSINITFIIAAVCGTISLFIFLVILVVMKKMKRPMRPRIKKTFKIHKNIEPLTYRPHTDQCEVIIEDCCNMNICETVSFFLRFFLEVFH